MSTKFSNRVSDNANRRRISIISQTPGEIIADIERADTNVTVPGTALTADILNAWDDGVSSAKITALSAKEESTIAKATANEAKSMAASAETSASNAQAVAQLVEGLRDQVTNGLGTRVQVNGTLQNQLFFTSDPQTQLNDTATIANAAKTLAEELDVRAATATVFGGIKLKNVGSTLYISTNSNL